MSTYICKCGKTFVKNTTASTTGNRMPDYGPEHECYGCLYVYETWVRNYSPDTQDQKVHECRASQILRYESSVRMINVLARFIALISTFYTGYVITQIPLKELNQTGTHFPADRLIIRMTVDIPLPFILHRTTREFSPKSCCSNTSLIRMAAGRISRRKQKNN